MGSLRHFLFYMAIFALAGLALGIAERIWGWSPGVTFALAVAAIAIIGTVVTLEALLAPHDRRGDSPERR